MISFLEYLMNEDAVLSCIEINNKDIVVNKAPELNKDVLC